MLSVNRPRKCKWCKESFTPERSGQKTHKHCEEPFALKVAGKLGEQRRRAERAQDKARRWALETPKKLLPKAQKVVNRWCRLRDLLAGRNCISCGATYRTAFGGVFDAGHFRSVGSAPHMRFYTPQIRLQCVRCNRDLSGNTVEFRKGLVALKGAAEVERIEGMYWIQKWTVDYLRRLIAVARKRGDRLEKRLKEQA
jgi:hypothetical protein